MRNASSPPALRFASFLLLALTVVAGVYSFYLAWTQENATKDFCELQQQPRTQPVCELVKSKSVGLWNATTLLICLWMILLGLFGTFLEVVNRQSMARRIILFVSAGSFATARGADIRDEDVFMLVSGALDLLFVFALVIVAMLLKSESSQPLLDQDGTDEHGNPFLGE